MSLSYYFQTVLKGNFDDVVEQITQALRKEGFGVLTDLDIQGIMEKKLGVEMPEYRILGACNPAYAYEALQKEDKIGAMLPCNVVVQQKGDEVEVAVVDPVASMQGVDNPELIETAKEVQQKLKNVVEALG